MKSFGDKRMMKFENGLYYNYYLHRKNRRECGFNLFIIPKAKLLVFAKATFVWLCVVSITVRFY